MAYVIAYVVFITVNLNRISISYGHEIPEWTIGIVLCVLLGPLVTIKDLSVFASCHIIADIIIVGCIFVIAIYSVTTISSEGVHPSVKGFTSIFTAMKIIGLSTGSYEANATLILIYKQAANKENYHKIEAPTIVTIITIYGITGIFAYLAFGTDSEAPITINLNQSLWIVELIELLYIAALLPTILLQNYPAMKILSSYTTDKMQDGLCKDMLQMFLRIAIIVSMIWLAVLAGDKFDTVLGFIGNLFCAPISYIIPAVIHCVLIGGSKLDTVRNIALMVFGGACAVIATGITIAGWFQ